MEGSVGYFGQLMLLKELEQKMRKVLCLIRGVGSGSWLLSGYSKYLHVVLSWKNQKNINKLNTKTMTTPALLVGYNSS